MKEPGFRTLAQEGKTREVTGRGGGPGESKGGGQMYAPRGAVRVGGIENGVHSE